MKIPEIAILLATYNGELYLAQQLDSIINQTNKDWLLYVRDDGSIDSTVEILKKYEQKNSNIIILNDSIKNRGAMNSFIWLMENVNSEYYMFCDQDDVWLPNKIEVSYLELLKIQSGNTLIPLLVFTDLFIVDESLNVISSSMWEYTHLKRVMDLKFLLIGSFATGCTMLFNNRAKLCALKYKNHALMHDSLLALSTLVNRGEIKGVSDSLIYYRQHGNNTLGTSKFNNSIISRFTNIRKVLRINYRYFRFVHAITNISIFKFLLLKMEAGYKIRNVKCVDNFLE